MNTLETLQGILIRDYALTREQLAPEAPLATLGVDSLGLIELMFHIEDSFGITLPDEKPAPLVTVGDLVTYVEGLMAPDATTPQPVSAATAPVA